MYKTQRVHFELKLHTITVSHKIRGILGANKDNPFLYFIDIIWEVCILNLTYCTSLKIDAGVYLTNNTS